MSENFRLASPDELLRVLRHRDFLVFLVLFGVECRCAEFFQSFFHFYSAWSSFATVPGLFMPEPLLMKFK